MRFGLLQSGLVSVVSMARWCTFIHAFGKVEDRYTSKHVISALSASSGRFRHTKESHEIVKMMGLWR